MLVGELGLDLVPDDLERAALDLVVEPGAAEDELPQPVDERLAADERDALPVAREVAAEPRLGILDHALRGERDEVARLLLVELVRLDEPELDRGGDHALLEVAGVEGEAVAEELDDVVVAGGVVRVDSVVLPRRIASNGCVPHGASGYGCSVLASAPHWQRLIILAPVFVIGAGLVLAVLILLGRAFAALGARERAQAPDLRSASVALVGVVVLLTYLGVELPKEG